MRSIQRPSLRMSERRIDGTNVLLEAHLREHPPPRRACRLGLRSLPRRAAFGSFSCSCNSDRATAIHEVTRTMNLPRAPLAASALALLLGCQNAPTHFTTGGSDVQAEKGKTYRWSFDDAAAGALPSDFINVLGDWKIQAEGSAPSGP